MAWNGVVICEEVLAFDMHGVQSGIQHLPEYDTSVLCAAASVVPCSTSQFRIDCASIATIGAIARGSNPGVDDQTRARFQLISLSRRVGTVQRVQQRCGRNLRGLR